MNVPRNPAAKFCYVLSLLVFATQADALIQKYRFHRISSEDGLSNMRVYCGLQDREGFVWFGTLDGLNRYDGIRFTVYRNNPFDSTTISDNVVLCICEDRRGSIWAGTFGGGLNVFDKTSQRFTRYVHDEANGASIRKGHVLVVFEDQSGRLLVGTDQGLDRLDRNSGRFTHYDGEYPVHALAEDAEGNIWVGTGRGLARLDESAQAVATESVLGLTSLARVNSILCETRGSVLLGTPSGVIQCEVKGKQIKKVTAGNPSLAAITTEINGLCRDHVGDLLVGTNDGLYRVSESAGQVLHHRNDPDDTNSLSDDIVRSVFEDRSGLLWVVTDYGITRYNRRAETFHWIIAEVDKEKRDVTAIHEDTTGKLWIGSVEGLSVIDKAPHLVRYQHDPGNRRSIGRGVVHAIHRDQNGRMWIGTWGGGLNQLDERTGLFDRYEWETQAVGGRLANIVYALTEDSCGHFWIAGWDDGLVRFDPRTHEFKRYQAYPADSNSLASNRIATVYTDWSGKVWVGTEGGGATAIECGSGSFRTYKNDPSNLHSLSNNRVYAIVEDRYGNIWLGTGGGLNKLDRKTGEFTHYYEEDGLPTNHLIRLTPDDRGRLWITTIENGISRFDPSTGTFKNFDVRDGLQSNEFTRASFRSQSGYVFLGGMNGFNMFHPDSIEENQTPPLVVLTSFKIFDRSPQLPFSIRSLASVNLRHDEDFFSFEFAALDFSLPEKNMYAYKLEGFDPEWNIAGTRHYASYTGVDPGDYVFRLKAANNDGVWNENGLSLQVHIDPPFWQTWWFRLLVLGAVAAMAFGAHEYRISKLKEIERIRIDIADDLHDELTGSLSGIALYADSVRRQLRKKKGGQSDPSATRMLKAIAAVARETTEVLRDQLWAIDPEKEQRTPLVEKMKRTAQRLLAGIEYNLQTDGDPHVLHMRFRHNVHLIFKEALNNIVKHSRAKRVSITIEAHHGMFSFQVADDGKGFDQGSITLGKGMTTMKRRAGEIGGNVVVSGSLGGGSAVHFSAKIP